MSLHDLHVFKFANILLPIASALRLLSLAYRSLALLQRHAEPLHSLSKTDSRLSVLHSLKADRPQTAQTRPCARSA